MKRLAGLVALVILSVGAHAQTAPRGTATEPVSATATAAEVKAPASAPAVPAATSAEGPRIPEWKKDLWQWGILPFQGENLSPENTLLTTSLPLQMIQRWRSVDTHHFSDAELESFRSETLKKAREDETRKLAAHYELRDGFLFRKDVKESERADNRSKIEASLKALEFLGGLEPQDIGAALFSKAKQVEQAGQGPLLETPKGAISEFMKTKALDLLITGRLVEYRQYLRVEITAWGPEGRILREWKDDMAATEVARRIDEARKDFQILLLGRPWSALDLRVTPDDAQIYLDGELAAVGSVTLPFAAPGTLVVKVRRPHYQGLQETVVLKPGEELLLERTLETIETPSFQVSTSPPGADIYLASVWKGKSPLSVDIPLGPSLLEARFAGYENLTLEVDPEQVTSLRLVLKPIVPRGRLIEAKDRFYTSMAFFTFSLISTVFWKSWEPAWNRVYQTYADNYLKNSLILSSEEKADLISKINLAYTMQQTFQNGSYVGWALTGGLFTWMMWELNGYIAAGEAEVF